MGDTMSKKMAPTKITSEACDNQKHGQRLASENLPLLLQNQAIAQGFVPPAFQSNEISMKGTSSSSTIVTQLKSLSAQINCGANGVGALGAMVWKKPKDWYVSLALQCHSTLVDNDSNPGWKLALKSNGDSTFGFSSAYWENTNLLNEGSDPLAPGNAKYDVFNTQPFSSIMLCVGGPFSNCVVHTAIAANLRTLFSSGYIRDDKLPQ